MGSLRNRRLMHDLADFTEYQAANGISLLHCEDDMSCIIVSLKGLSGTQHEGVFNIEMRIPANFPFGSPKIYMTTPIWHPNIDEDDGRVCMDIINEKWTSGISLVELAEAVRSLLSDPNPASPLNAKAAVLLETNKALYFDNALLWTKVFAEGNQSSPLEEKWSVLVALGMETREAARQGSLYQWDVAKIIEDFSL